VFSSVFKLNGAQIELMGISTGCRTSVLLATKDIACLWDVGNIPRESEEAFQLGANIAAYATGLEPLPDKLDAVRLVATSGPEAPVAPQRGAVELAQLMHNGDWRPNVKSVPQLASVLHQMGVDIVPAAEPLRATDPKLAQHPIVYITGHYSFALNPEETQALRQHLQRGGFLIANACCGRKAFDESFRKLAAKMFPDQPLAELPASHPILAGRPGVPLKTVAYRPSLRAEQPNLNKPVLEAITLEGRVVLVYSRYSLDCGMDGHKCFACRGLEPDDARRMAANAVLYALSY
jgi:hypothetical protein